jgi:16S rRNA (adenine1518-N6/adenine1519-N6)-dimethyltransferase
VHPAKRSLGQNFLIDPNLQRKIVLAVDPRADDTVVEIGPGRGALTHALAGSAGRLFAIELDDDLAADLARAFDDVPGVTIVHRNVLDVSLDEFGEPDRLKVVGNIPYNITSPIIFHLLERGRRPATIILMIQREVADRLVASPGTAEYGALTVGVQAVAAVERLFHAGRGAFRPVPNVDSTVVRITPHRPPRLSAGEEVDLRALTRTAFGWRRKQLQKTLRAAPAYALDAEQLERIARETGIALDRRAESLAIDQFTTLARALRALGKPEMHP